MFVRFYVIVFCWWFIGISTLTGASLPHQEEEFFKEKNAHSQRISLDEKPIDNSFHLLFLCTGNSCRSQIAEGWARHFSDKTVSVCSAGIRAYGLNSRAIQVMEEVGVDIKQQTSKVLTIDMLEWANIVITVCGDADEHCPLLPSGTIKIHWPIFDPATATGTEEEILTKFREIRDELQNRIRLLLKSALTE